MFERVVENAPWTARAYFKVVNLAGKLVLMSGRNGLTYLGDVWESPNGEDWTQILPDDASRQIGSFGACVHDRRLFVNVGLPNPISTLVASPDGINQQTFTDRPWTARYDGEMVSYDGRLWLIGGDDGDYCNDVWWTRDGVTWVEALPNGHAYFSPRSDHRILSHAGRLWVIGGTDDNGYCSDVWSSADGIHWTQETPAAAFGGINNHAIVSFDNRIVVVTGSKDGVDEAKLWHSLDGVLWEGGRDAEFDPRGEFALEVFDNRIYLFGGESGGTVYNDVWRTVGMEF